MSTELRRKVARDHVERLYRQIGEAYLESSRGSYPEDPKLAERIGQLSQKDDAESQAKRLEKLAELGRRIEKSSDEQVQGRLRILIGRLESAQAELAEIEAKVGERPPGRPEKPRKVKKILIGFAAVAVLTLVVIVALVAAGVVAIPGTGP